MLRTLRNSAAVMVAMAALAAPLAAQTTQAPAEPAAPAATQPAAAALPQALVDLGITDATVGKSRRGQQVRGNLPGGGAFRAMLDSKGELRMIRAEGAALPADLVQRLLPQAVRDHATTKDFAQIQGVGRGDQGVMLFGTDAQGQGIRAGFGNDGTLQRFGRGEMDGKGHKARGARDRGQDRGMDWRGKDRGNDRGEMMKRMQHFHRGDRGPQAASTVLDDAAVQRLLQDAGYAQPGAITRDGPRIEVEAVNPEGEPVTVTISPRGMVVRELAR